MMEKGAVARAVLEGLAGMPLPEWSIAERNIGIVRLARTARLFQAGDPCPFVFFVREGLVKLCYESADGEEWIKGFAHEGRFFASMAALTSQGESSFSVVALESTELERIEYACLLRLAETHLAWQRALRRGLELYGSRKEQRERELLTLSASERYSAWLRDNEALSARVPQKDLARYLGITPVGLSRMRSRFRVVR